MSKITVCLLPLLLLLIVQTAGGAVHLEVGQDRSEFLCTSGGKTIRILPLDRQGRQHTDVAPFYSDEREKGHFFVDDEGDLLVTPGVGIDRIQLRGEFAGGLLPGLKLESIAYFPESFPGLDTVCVPSENWFALLLEAGQGILICSWPSGDQRIELLFEGREDGRRLAGLEIHMEEKELYLALMMHDGIWAREELEAGDLERDVKLAWRPPFHAHWESQVPVKGENLTARTFGFRDGRGNAWRPEIGNYVWPLWFSEGAAFVHLSKKLPPLGELVIVPMDGHEMSLRAFGRRTPMDQLFEARTQWYGLPEGSRNAPNVGFNACWGTHFLRRTVYLVGLQEREKEYLLEHTEYLADRVHMVQKRNMKYSAFLQKMTNLLSEWIADEQNQSVHDYLGKMERHLQQVAEGHEQKMALFGCRTPEEHMAKADRYEARLKMLLSTPGPEIYPECEHILDTFNRLSWGHDEMTGMRFSMSTREWARSAAWDCAGSPEAVPLGQRIRGEIREELKGAAKW